MATLTASYRGSIMQYRRYIEAVQKRPVLQASLFVVLSLLLLILLVAFALRPTLLTIAGLYGDLGSQRKIALQLDRRIQDQAAAAQIYSQIQSQLPLLDSAIPNTPSIEVWMAKLDAYAADNTVAITTVNISKTAIPKDVTGKIMTSEFFMTVRGEFANLKTFLKLLESNRRLVDIGDVALGRNASLDSELQMIITGQILYSKQ